MALCVSCGKKTSEKFVEFGCPGCGKEKLIRCADCRVLGARYTCSKCGFNGP